MCYGDAVVFPSSEYYPLPKKALGSCREGHNNTLKNFTYTSCCQIFLDLFPDVTSNKKL